MLDYLYTWVDPSLNYGRQVVSNFIKRSGPYDAILDIAAGSGADLIEARRLYPQARLIAFDCLTQSVAHLERLGFTTHRLDVERDAFPLRPGEVDLIIANQVLEHTKEIFWIFHQIARALPIGGRLIIGVPNLASLHNRILLAFGRQPTPIRSASAHVRGFTRADLIDFMETCFPGGFRLCAHAGSNFYPFPPTLARPLARALPSLAWGAFFLFEKQRDYQGEFIRFPSARALETNFFQGPNDSRAH